MRWMVELSSEVLAWHRRLSPGGHATTDRVLDRLEVFGNQMRLATRDVKDLAHLGQDVQDPWEA